MDGIFRINHFFVSTLNLILLVASFSLTAQEDKEKALQPTIGVTWRSTTVRPFKNDQNFFQFAQNNYDGERNVQGFSLNLGLQYQLTNSLIVEYYPNLRYDVTHNRWDTKYDELFSVTPEGDSLSGNSHPIKVKNFLIDHNFNIIRKPDKIAYGVGMTIVNSGESYEYPLNYRDPSSNIQTQNIQFNTYNVFVTFPVKEVLNLEIKALYIPNGFPENVNEEHLMFSMRLYYKFKFLKQN